MVARIKLNGKLKFLGHHKTEDAAGLAYNKAAYDAWGDDAYQNPLTKTTRIEDAHTGKE